MLVLALCLVYIGHAHLCVCLSLAAFPHYCMDPDITWGNGRRYRQVVHYWQNLRPVHGFRSMTTWPEHKRSANPGTCSMPGASRKSWPNVAHY